MIEAKISHSFIRNLVSIDWPDIEFGMRKRFIAPEIAIAEAKFRVKGGNPALEDELELASCRPSDSIMPIVERLARVSPIQDRKRMSEMWLYLILAWLYENRSTESDPLKTIEAIYATFDYPVAIESFVRYMPMSGPHLGSNERNVNRLIENWHQFLVRERRRFSPIR